MAAGRHVRWLSDAVDRWANVFVDLSFADRIQDLRVAAFAALQVRRWCKKKLSYAAGHLKLCLLSF